MSVQFSLVTLLCTRFNMDLNIPHGVALATSFIVIAKRRCCFREAIIVVVVVVAHRPTARPVLQCRICLNRIFTVVVIKRVDLIDIDCYVV